MKNDKYTACWYCDNILDHPEQVGLLYLGFPRCFVLIPNSFKIFFSSYEEFVNGASQINWLDPSDKGSSREQKEVLTKLWNFSVEQENKEDELYGEREEDEDC